MPRQGHLCLPLLYFTHCNPLTTSLSRGWSFRTVCSDPPPIRTRHAGLSQMVISPAPWLGSPCYAAKLSSLRKACPLGGACSTLVPPLVLASSSTAATALPCPCKAYRAFHTGISSVAVPVPSRSVRSASWTGSNGAHAAGSTASRAFSSDGPAAAARLSGSSQQRTLSSFGERCSSQGSEPRQPRPRPFSSQQRRACCLGASTCTQPAPSGL